ncbi:DinB family protein [Candidatus Bipolaricaulota bacterium]|nr:DinB family protein [Candidatus Bipolaricaulota bacterium]
MGLASSRIADYYTWIHKDSPSSPVVDGPFEIELVEEFNAYASKEDPKYLVNAFFEDDRRPLSSEDVEIGLRLLGWTRQDLLKVLRELTPEQLNKPIKSEVRGNIMGILEHVCGAENWYFSQLGMDVNWSTLPNDIEGRLNAVRANTRAQLAKLIGESRITESYGERWSARKILRRTLWHERAHTEQIARLATQ